MIVIKKLPKKKQNSINKNLSKTKLKVSNEWKRYQKKKATIKRRYKTKEAQQKHIEQLMTKTKQKISSNWADYQGKKYTIVYRDKFTARLFKSKFDTYTQTNYYKSKNNINNANKDILQLIKKNKNVKYILIDFKMEHIETGAIRIVSDSFTPEGFERVKDEDLFQLLLEKSLGWSDSDSLENFELKYYTIRMIKDLPESQKGKVHRDYSKK